MSRFDKIKNLKLLKIILAFLGLILAAFVVVKISPYLVPFIIAFIIASIIEPIIRFLMNKIKIRRKLAAPIVLTFFILAFVLIITLIVARLIREIKSISATLPEITSNIYAFINSLISKGVDIFEWLPVNITGNIGNIISKLYETVSDILNSVVKGAYITAASIPRLLFIVMTIVSTYFISSDREKMSNFFSTQFPKKWIDQVKNITTNMFSALIGYIKAQ